MNPVDPRRCRWLALARADGSYPRLLARFARIDVLVLDDWGLVPVQDIERRDLLEIMGDRHGLRSTICSCAIHCVGAGASVMSAPHRNMLRRWRIR